MQNTRTAPRHKRRFRVLIDSRPSFTLDLGAGGFATEVMYVLQTGEPVRGSLRVNGADVAYAGEVVWVRAGDAHLSLRGRMGIHFTKLPDEVRRLLASPTLHGVA